MRAARCKCLTLNFCYVRACIEICAIEIIPENTRLESGGVVIHRRARRRRRRRIAGRLRVSRPYSAELRAQFLFTVNKARRVDS